ncbi:MAG TPA: GAF domain-containing sensor histidine kinase [Candidatus Thermoplasmatota archaeon]|nr:GAF domain-containing sensor histidine kinase [Candidatus Thermoplasmatota archaeon]
MAESPRSERTVEELQEEEQRHVREQVMAAREGDVRRVEEKALEHHEKQTEATDVLLDYERILDAALSNLKMPELSQEMLERTRTLLDVEFAAVLFKSGDRLEPVAASGIPLDRLPDKVHPGEWFAGKVMNSMRPQALHGEEISSKAHPRMRAEGVQALLGVPLILEGEPTGVLVVGSMRERRFEEQDTNLLQLVADRLALAMDRARLLDQEQARRAKAETANAYKTTLLHMASHDLRTPLTAIKLQSSVMRRAREDPQRHERSANILTRNIHRLEMMLDDFLDLARMEAGRFTLHVGEVDLRKVVDEVVETFEAQATDRDIKLTRDCPTPLLVQGDERRLIQTFNNLISNSLRYTPDLGTIHIESRDLGDRVVVKVADNGIGMTREQLSRLFEPFTQHAGHTIGTGLGLFLAKTVVEEHGGDIRVDSLGPDKGTTATLHIPKQPV